jgi:hypothetical protein
MDKSTCKRRTSLRLVRWTTKISVVIPYKGTHNFIVQRAAPAHHTLDPSKRV